MNAPYQRITVPTSEKWNSIGQNGSSTATSSIQQASISSSSQALVIQPPHSLVVSAPNQQVLNAAQSIGTKKFARLKPMLWAGLL